MEIIFNTQGNEKQKTAARAWVNPAITDIGYGGAKFGGKSYLGVNLIFGDAFIYPDTRYFIARNTLNDLRKWTSGTIDKVFGEWGVTPRMYKFNGQDNFYQLYNDSRVYLVELAYKPTDPDFARFGSREFTRGWIEEEGEVMAAAAQNIEAAVGRYHNSMYDLTGKCLHTFNPSKNHLYRKYYKAAKEATLPDYRVFVNALPTDNKTPGSAEYVANLHRILTQNQKQRLLFGNWDYDDDPSVMCDWSSITDVFTNEIKISGDDNKRISADLAMKGRDRFVAGVFDGNSKSGIIVRIAIDKAKASGIEIEKDIKSLMQSERAGHSKTIVDSDGMGQYLESYLNGIVEFHGAGSAVNVEFAKIKDELAYKLAELINKRLLRIICTDEQREKIEQQLSALKANDIDADTKKKSIVSKDIMKEQLGESPDYLDMLLMGMWFEVHKPSTGYIGR